MNLTKRFVLYCFLMAFQSFSGITFKKENITVNIIACDTFEVQGIYFFENRDSSSATIMIHYPFPLDDSWQYPNYISVVNLTTRKSIHFVEKKDGVNWYLSLPPFSVDSTKVIYRQRVFRQRGRYILTTTRDWKKPLEEAAFKVVVPENSTLTYWSFQSDSVSVKNGQMIYQAWKENFYPEEDLLLEWSCE